jgi:hypothetical protein
MPLKRKSSWAGNEIRTVVPSYSKVKISCQAHASWSGNEININTLKNTHILKHTHTRIARYRNHLARQAQQKKEKASKHLDQLCHELELHHGGQEERERHLLGRGGGGGGAGGQRQEEESDVWSSQFSSN